MAIDLGSSNEEQESAVSAFVARLLWRNVTRLKA